MKQLNSIKIILLGISLSILFSLITYQNFSHNIESILEEQESKATRLVESNVQIILDKINRIIQNTIEFSMNNEVLLNMDANNQIKINDFLLLLKTRLSSSYLIHSVDFISSNEVIFTVNKEFEGCFAVEGDSSFYKVDYPVYFKDKYIGFFEIRLENKQILTIMSKYINAETALFVKKNTLLTSSKANSHYSFSDYIVTDSTNNKFIKSVLRNQNFTLEDTEEVMNIDDRLIEIDSINLSGQDDKVLVVFHDVTDSYNHIEAIIDDIIIYFIVLLLVFLLISYYIYYNSNKTIVKQYNELHLKNNEFSKLLKVKSEFLANMSHEIRTPLNAINGFIDLIEEQSKDKKILKYIHTIQQSSKILLHVIEDILDLSKIESGKMSINKIDFDTRSEFETIVYLFNTKISNKNLFFDLDIDERLPPYLKSDSLRIKQVISNLIDNAIKFTESGKKITVNIFYKDADLHVSVKDEGIGISEDRQKKIFMPFTQADNSTTRKYGGTGLGLTISSQIIKLLGGTLKLESEPNKGSTFYFSIPVSIGNAVIVKKDNANTFNFVDKKILVVEDNKSNQLFMKVILKGLKIDFDIANDGLEAIKYFKTGKYDVILMDENMPNMSGIEATKKILEIELNNNILHTPIIALTANALDGDKMKFLNAGMDEYLSKPIDKNKLSKVLSRYLS